MKVRIRWERDTGVWANRPTARFVYHCDECGAAINIGQRYYSVESMRVYRLCEQCGARREIDAPARYRPEVHRRRATVLTLRWAPNVSRAEVHRLSRTWAQQASENHNLLTEVRVQVVAEDAP